MIESDMQVVLAMLLYFVVVVVIGFVYAKRSNSSSEEYFLVLYFLEHRETAEIAKLVGRPPATVNSQLWRAKLLLRQQITERRQKE